MPNTRGSRAGSGANNGPDDLVRVLRDEQIIELRRDGMALRQIASSVGVAVSTVQAAITRWMDERGPSAEQVEELRQFQGAQLDAYQAKLAPHLMRPLRDDDGAIVIDPATGERAETPDVAVGQLYLRLLERRAKLYGLDLQQGAYVPQITAEMVAAYFFDETDPLYVGPLYVGDRPIDVDGEELPAAEPISPNELEPGADPR